MRLDKRKIQIFMARKSMKQKELAESAGVSRQTISYVMNGRSCRPEIAGRIARILGVDVTEILED